MAGIQISPEMHERFHREAYIHIKEPVFNTSDFLNLRDYLMSYVLALHAETRGTYFTGNQTIKRPLYQDWVSAPVLVDLVEQILGPDIAYFNFALCYKPPQSEFRVGMHIDSHYWVETGCIDPHKVLTLFIPLTPIRKAEGCLKVLPGIDECKLYPHKKLDPKINYFHWEIEENAADFSKVVEVEMEENQICLIKSGLIHGSDRNSSPDHRLGLTIRYISAAAKYRPIENDPRKMILLRGENLAGNEYFNLDSKQFVGGFSWSK